MTTDRESISTTRRQRRGWGWFSPTSWDISEFTTPGDQGEQQRMDLLTALMLVLQADSKAYAEDEHLLKELRSLADKPVVIVLNQVDTLPRRTTPSPPSRGGLGSRPGPPRGPAFERGSPSPRVSSTTR